MLETEALTKICPMTLAKSRTDEDSDLLCYGPKCIAWEEWSDPIYEETKMDYGKSRKHVGNKPKEPPQGHCGMIPPELNCER